MGVDGAHAAPRWTLYSRPGGPLPQMVRYCAYKAAAFQYAQQLTQRSDWLQRVHDSLELDAMCQQGQPEGDKASRTAVPAPAAGAIYVDCVHGQPGAPGTEQQPVDSVQAGVQLSRSSGARTVVVRQGTCFLSAPVQLDTRDHGLTIQSMPGEQAVLSGAVQLQPAWQPAPGLPNVLVAQLESTTPYFTTLYDSHGSMLSRARYPNNPDVVSHGLWTANLTGYASPADAHFSGPIKQTGCSKVK